MGSCSGNIYESSRLTSDDLSPALSAAREKRPLALYIEKSSGASTPGSTGKPAVNASAENGL